MYCMFYNIAQYCTCVTLIEYSKFFSSSKCISQPSKLFSYQRYLPNNLLPQDFLTSLFIPIPKVSKATSCDQYRTISLSTHASKILLHLIKERITPIIERNLSDSQFGFRKGKMLSLYRGQWVKG